MYGPQIGRWNGRDGKTGIYFNWSPYIYARNTPNNAVSNGNAKHPQNSNNTKVRNYRAVDKKISHGNIPEKAQPHVNKMIEQILKGQEIEGISS